MKLQEFFDRNPKAALGFSGGVDSSYLLCAALRCGADVRAYYVKTPFQPQFELEDALRLADGLGAAVTVLEPDLLCCDQVTSNPTDRCYHCKKVIFSALREQALRDGYQVLIDGTNASDDLGDRPGVRALRELSVRSPLRECGLEKAEIRRLSRCEGLFTWNKPAYACLATRVPTGRRITPGLLARVEKAEDALFALGFTDFRVRVYGDAARLQLPPAQLQRALERRGEITAALRPYFYPVLLDMEERGTNG
ncbi:ATP-dependent sacrificial sulfur transferase LarE [Anaerofilum sp. BX8]|uniref:ATP-dependent sacrificial sulfur transferase LarE n=1 Tax=Anaerofilum hominis TaxID=2763016 RepID=A0A923L0Q4_9FIRM|nr:ATP-dependent sacrificial sulfur transferase LarE [Anaerofilum hominis]MBC5580732.1 ATP-dependent sacrificial sulfur transferase LarE [Anaerofilum hominis]